MKNAVDNGSTINYTNGGGTTIPSGRLFAAGHILAVAIADIAPGATGACQVTGKVTAPKVSGAVFGVGEKLVFDVSAGSGVGAFDDSAATPAAGDLTGAAVAAEAGTDGQTSCVVILTPGNATLTAGG
jgi:predicted RecA/RadA family phage recombinase